MWDLRLPRVHCSPSGKPLPSPRPSPGPGNPAAAPRASPAQGSTPLRKGGEAGGPGRAEPARRRAAGSQGGGRSLQVHTPPPTCNRPVRTSGEPSSPSLLDVVAVGGSVRWLGSRGLLGSRRAPTPLRSVSCSQRATAAAAQTQRMAPCGSRPWWWLSVVSGDTQVRSWGQQCSRHSGPPCGDTAPGGV